MKGTFELSDSAADAFGEGHGGVLVDGDSFNICSFEEDGALGFGIGVLNIDDEPGFEARAESFIHEKKISRGSIGAEDDLLAEGLKVVKGVEDFLEGFIFARDVLDVIEEPDIDATLLAAESLDLVVFERGHEVFHELGRGDVHDAVVRVAGEEFVGDGVEEVGFAESAWAVDKERIVARSGSGGDGFGSADGESVGIADHEVLEGQALYRLEFCGF